MKSIKKGVLFLIVLEVLLLYSGCSQKYTCYDCGKVTSEAYYDVNWAGVYYCANCAREHYAPLPYGNYRYTGKPLKNELEEDVIDTTSSKETDKIVTTNNQYSDNNSFIATIIYDANGGYGAPESHTAAIVDGVARYVLSEQQPFRDGFNFVGWRLDNNTAYDIDQPGQSIAIERYNSCRLVYYAQWSVNTDSQYSNNNPFTATIIYDANGGSGAPEPQTVAIVDGVARYVLAEQQPVRAGYNFAGWRLDNDRAYNVDNPGQPIAIGLDGSCTLTYYAQWN